MACPSLTITTPCWTGNGRYQAHLIPIHVRCSRLSIPYRLVHAGGQRQRPRGLSMVWQGRRDPLEASIWDSWRDQEEEWDTEKFTEDELVDILFEDDGSAETTAQNILAIALSLLLALALGSILWRVTVVSLALLSAAVRYSIVGVLLLVLAVVFF